MFDMIQIINKKKYGQNLSAEEIKNLIQAYTEGTLPDYQMSAFLMAVYFNGLSNQELGQLTLAMAESGDQIDLSAIAGQTVDKHSTGGVGDTTSLIVVPLVAACGGYVAKMSGRSLGHTGGTLDKLESIPHYQLDLDPADFIQQVNQLGGAIVGQTANLAPADKKIYALRDVTATVDSIPLIASSIMSKKLASAAQAIVLDVKVGRGAFMKDLDQAQALARAMIAIGQQADRKVRVVISDMSQPLGRAIGNSLEVTEAIQVLKGQGPADLRQLSLSLAAQMIRLSDLADDDQAAYQLAEEKLDGGQALSKFKAMVDNQGGDSSLIDQFDVLNQASVQIEVAAPQAGRVSQIDALALGQLAHDLGAGRQSLNEAIDLQAGMVLEKKVGDRVEEGECLAVLYSNKLDLDKTALQERVMAAFSIAEKAETPPLIHQIL